MGVMTIFNLNVILKFCFFTGKRVILDLVPNQTSKKHPWFVKSQKKEEKYKDYYVWKSGSTTPNDWVRYIKNNLVIIYFTAYKLVTLSFKYYFLLCLVYI